MDILRHLRRLALALLVVAFVAGCASPPPAENAPDDLNCDGDMDGIPDGQSPSDGTNTRCDGPSGDQDPAMNETDPDALAENEQGMPGVLP